MSTSVPSRASDLYRYAISQGNRPRTQQVHRACALACPKRNRCTEHAPSLPRARSGYSVALLQAERFFCRGSVKFWFRVALWMLAPPPGFGPPPTYLVERSARMHTAGGISVRVNAKEPTGSGSGGDVVTLSSVTWRAEAPRYAVGGLTVKKADANPALKLVQVIRVSATDPSACPGNANIHILGGYGDRGLAASDRNIVTSDRSLLTSDRILAKSDRSLLTSDRIVAKGDRIIARSEDERSSSGASSAPGSDCDSDKEADDGTDSGFSPDHCARVSVTAGPYSSLTSDGSGGDEIPKGRSDVVTVSSYRDAGPDVNMSMHFHLKELDSVSAEERPDSEDVQSKIAAAHALLSGSGAETYCFKSRVRSSIVSLLVQTASKRNYEHEEMGRIVFYTTSMGIVRNTFERCRKVRKILETLMVKFEERDVFMNRGFQQEVRERLAASRVIVPQLFMEGRHLGSAEIVEQLNEIGQLRELLRPYKRQSVGGTCHQCGGYRYLLCPICGGSKKSVTHRHHFTEDLVALRCVTCDESGLIRCSQCINGDG